MQEKTKCIEYDYKDDGRGIILLLLTEAAHMVHGIQGRSECRISGRPPEDSARHQSQICLGGDPTRDTHQVYYFISNIESELLQSIILLLRHFQGCHNPCASSAAYFILSLHLHIYYCTKSTVFILMIPPLLQYFPLY